MTELQDFLSRGKARVDAALDAALPPAADEPAVLHEALRYTLLLPAKRIRGVLVLAAAELLRGDEDAVVPLACSVEMVHAASLILDDLPSMDNATLRRGRPALHRVVGEANAVLAAVGLLNLAYATLAQSPLKERARVDAAACLTRAIGDRGLVAGQVVDLASTGARLDLDALEYVHSHKTGALFIAAAELGAIGAGARGRDLAALSRYAKNLGLAFQITDDLLDYSGDPATTGKDAGLDRDKTTFVNLCGIEGARRLVDELIEASIAALGPFGRRGALLAALAEMVRDRDR
jgi:geranylgeranyl diphosphate synthase type II